MATATRTAAPKFEVVKVWEWEDKYGEPQIRIQRDGHGYEDIGVAMACANTFNDCRSKASIDAGVFYAVMTPKEIAMTVTA